MENLHNMENGLIAKDINNTQKSRVNMSLKYMDGQGKMQGYIFAYEGRESGQEMIYVADLAASPSSKLAGGKLIKAFVSLYKKNYLDQGKLIPILADAREKTSYRIIIKQLDRISEELGANFNLEEINTHQRGGERMHLIEIKPMKN